MKTVALNNIIKLLNSKDSSLQKEIESSLKEEENLNKMLKAHEQDLKIEEDKYNEAKKALEDKIKKEEKKKEKEKEKEDNDNLILFHNKIDNNNISHIEINSSLDDRFFDDSKFIDYSFLREIEEIREKEKEDRKKNQNNDLIDALQIFDNVDEKMKENKTKIVNRPKKSFFENLFQNFCCELNQ
jgi:hypothetical protein